MIGRFLSSRENRMMLCNFHMHNIIKRWRWIFFKNTLIYNESNVGAITKTECQSLDRFLQQKFCGNIKKIKVNKADPIFVEILHE